MVVYNSSDYTFLPLVGLDIETTGLSYWDDRVVVIAVQSGNTSYIWETSKFSKEFFTELLSTIDTAVIHTAKFDLGFLKYNYGVVPKFYCTYMASKILTNGKDFSNSLVNCLKHYLGVGEEVHQHKEEIQLSFGSDLTQEQLEYIVADIKHLVPLRDKLEPLLLADGLEKVMTLEHKLLPVLLAMEQGGVRIDDSELRRFAGLWDHMLQLLTDKLDDAVDGLYAKANLPFDGINYNSTKQVTGIFKNLKLKVPTKVVYKRVDGKRTKLHKESVDYDTLQEWLNQNPNHALVAFVKLLLRQREFAKLKSTYGAKLLKRLRDGKLHGNLNQLGAATGRLSSSNPNLQNIPLEGPGGRVRRCFLPDPGDLMLTCDMSAAEVRIAADLSQDKLLLDSFKEGVDMHSKLASASFSLIAGETVITKSEVPVVIGGHSIVPNEVRHTQKTATFARFYRCGPMKIKSIFSKYLNMYQCPKDTPGKIMAEMDKQLGGLTDYMNTTIAKANEYKYLKGRIGRIRYFPKGAYGDAANQLIQNQNAESIKIAMIKVHEYLTSRGYGRILLSIHDELVCSVHPEIAEEAAQEIKKIMSESLGWFLRSLPGEAEYKIAKYWKK